MNDRRWIRDHRSNKLGRTNDDLIGYALDAVEAEAIADAHNADIEALEAENAKLRYILNGLLVNRYLRQVDIEPIPPKYLWPVDIKLIVRENNADLHMIHLWTIPEIDRLLKELSEEGDDDKAD